MKLLMSEKGLGDGTNEKETANIFYQQKDSIENS